MISTKNTTGGWISYPIGIIDGSRLISEDFKYRES